MTTTWLDTPTRSVWHLTPHLVISAHQVYRGWRVRVLGQTRGEEYEDRESAKAAAMQEARAVLAKAVGDLQG